MVRVLHPDYRVRARHTCDDAPYVTFLLQARLRITLLHARSFGRGLPSPRRPKHQARPNSCSGATSRAGWVAEGPEGVHGRIYPIRRAYPALHTPCSSSSSSPSSPPTAPVCAVPLLRLPASLTTPPTITKKDTAGPSISEGSLGQRPTCPSLLAERQSPAQIQITILFSYRRP